MAGWDNPWAIAILGMLGITLYTKVIRELGYRDGQRYLFKRMHQHIQFGATAKEAIEREYLDFMGAEDK